MGQSDSSSLEFHEFAEIFPLIDDVHFDELSSDIKANGLLEKIWLFEGRILDGRNRYLAALAAEVKPEFREYTGPDALAFVLSLNVHRRHLSASQRAMAAAQIATLSAGRKKSNAQNCAISQSKSAELMNVSRRSVQQAKLVVENGSSQLKKAVTNGHVAVSKAAAVIDLPKREQLKAATEQPAKYPDEPERPDDIDEGEALESANAELMASLQRSMGTDALAELKSQAAEIASLKMARDGFMRGKAEMTRLLQAEQRKCQRLQKKLDAANAELAKIRGEMECE